MPLFAASVRGPSRRSGRPCGQHGCGACLDGLPAVIALRLPAGKTREPASGRLGPLAYVCREPVDLAGPDVTEASADALRLVVAAELPRPLVDILEQVPVGRSHVVGVVGTGNRDEAQVQIVLALASRVRAVRSSTSSRFECPTLVPVGREYL